MRSRRSVAAPGRRRTVIAATVKATANARPRTFRFIFQGAPSPTSSWRKPGPLTTDVFDERDWSSSTSQQLTFVVMGPGLRRDDTECVAAIWFSIADKLSRSRGVTARGLRRPSPQRRGSRECRVRAAPAVSCAGCAKEMHTSIQVQRETLRHSLRNGLTAYAALSPATSSSCHRRPRIDGERPARSGGFAFANLTPATGARTTRFCRTQQRRSSCTLTARSRKPPCEQTCAPTLPRPPHPIPRS